MRIRFWGVRGSIPAPGPETNRYGGNTSCTSIELSDGHLVVLDMGTGVMHLGNSLMGGPFGNGKGEGTVLLSHAHWDHIQGFPFFPPIFVPGNSFQVYGNADSPGLLERILEGQMNPNFSPIYTLKNLGADIDFKTVTSGDAVQFHNAELRAVVNPHGSTTALAFRIDEGGHSVVYAPDVGYGEGGPSEEALALYRGADVLIHDSTYTPEDQASRLGRGLSSYVDAADVAVNAGVGQLVLFHYDQDYSDDDVDGVVTACRAELDRRGGKQIALAGAREGLTIDL